MNSEGITPCLLGFGLRKRYLFNGFASRGLNGGCIFEDLCMKKGSELRMKEGQICV